MRIRALQVEQAEAVFLSFGDDVAVVVEDLVFRERFEVRVAVRGAADEQRIRA